MVKRVKYLTHLTKPQGMIKKPATTAQADIRKGTSNAQPT